MMSEPMIVTMPIRLEYDYSPGAGRSRFLRGLARGKILGERCAKCKKVYVGGGSGWCPRDGVPTEEVVELPDVGTITTFCGLNVPFAGATVGLPSGVASVEKSGVPREKIGFTCSGSCDYLAGQPFAFVWGLEAIAAWPPIRESHVEMDGAWALYEAWVLLQEGEIDAALVYGFGKS